MILLWTLIGLAWAWPVPTDSNPPWEQRPSGLKVAELVVGDGEQVVPGARVEVHYLGMLDDGTVFDESRGRNSTFVFEVGASKVIRGWDEGLVGMKVGGTRRLEIPSSLGYGDQGAGPIPPGARLWFEIELVSVQAPRAAPAKPRAVSKYKGSTNTVQIARVKKGDGGKARSGKRVCIDYAVYVDGAVAEHSYLKDPCLWIRFEETDVPEPIHIGLKGMREGGQRQLRLPHGTPWGSLQIAPNATVVVDLELVEAAQ